MKRAKYSFTATALLLFLPAALALALTAFWPAGAGAANAKVSFDNLRRTIDKCTKALSYIAEVPGATETVYSQDPENFRKDVRYSDSSAISIVVTGKKGWTYEPATKNISDTSEAAIAAITANDPAVVFSSLVAAGAEISEKQAGSLLVYTLIDKAKKTRSYKYDFMVELNSGALIRIVEYTDKSETSADIKFRGHKFARKFDRAMFKKPDLESLAVKAKMASEAKAAETADAGQGNRKKYDPVAARRECLKNLDGIEAAAAKYKKEKNDFPADIEALVKGSYMAAVPVCREDGKYGVKGINDPEECAIAMCSFHGAGKNGDHARLASLFASRALSKSVKGDHDGSISDYDRAIELEPTNEVHFVNRGTQYYNKKDFTKAIDDCDRAIQINRDFTSAYIWRGEAHREKGELDNALADYNRAIELDTGECQAYYNRSFVYKLKGENAKSEADMKIYKELTEKSDEKEEPKKP